LKENTHIGLVKIVGNLAIMDTHNLQVLMESAIEPDQINKTLIAQDLINALVIPFDWLINHTIRAKQLAIKCITQAYHAYRENDPSWIRFAGWASHYIADWGTPHHSPVSKSNPVLALAGGGAFLGGLIGGLKNAEKGLKESLLGIMKGALVGAGVLGSAGLIILAISHSEFEKRCDLRWDNLENQINSRFLETRKDFIIPLSFIDRLTQFEIKMDELRRDCNNLDEYWIEKSSNEEFINYMLKIAHVIDFAFQIITE